MSDSAASHGADRELHRPAEAFGELALQGVCAAAPYLAGLAAAIRLSTDPRVGMVGVFASGHIVVNPRWFPELDLHDAIFVLTHELMHLVLHSHTRLERKEGELFNLAHDFVINDLLRVELGMTIPPGGPDLPGAHERAAEQLVDELRKRRRQGRSLIEAGEISGAPYAAGDSRALNTALADALRAGGWVEPDASSEPPLVLLTGDVLSLEQELEWFPTLEPGACRRRAEEIEGCCLRALHLCRLDGVLRSCMGLRRGNAPGQGGTLVTALRSLYRPPWELALQQWMEAVAPGPRTYVRPSRRGADRLDVVLPGRKREGWTLHLVLDTSGSMTGTLPALLGVIAAFCESTGVGLVHLVQCDTRVTSDEWIDPAGLAAYTVRGFGGSDMSPAMLHLAADPEVEAVLVVTDGCISYPPGPLPYEVLWAISHGQPFNPTYGRMLRCLSEGEVNRG